MREERKGNEKRGFYRGQSVPLTRRLPPAYNGLVLLLILFFRSVKAGGSEPRNNYTNHNETVRP